MSTRSAPASAPVRRPLTWPAVFAVVVLGALVTALATVWAVKQFVFPDRFTPVRLNAQEAVVLEAKLQRLGADRAGAQARPLEPEPYSEVGARREVVLSERELNAYIARNTDLATRLALDLSENLASAKLLVTLDPQAPVLGGRTVQLTAGLALGYAEGRPVVALKGVKLWGVPIPDAWLGGLKNVDLVEAYGGQAGFWQGFAAGVEDLKVEEGRLRIRLKE